MDQEIQLKLLQMLESKIKPSASATYLLLLE
jgi:hypothetical protein